MLSLLLAPSMVMPGSLAVMLDERDVDGLGAFDQAIGDDAGDVDGGRGRAGRDRDGCRSAPCSRCPPSRCPPTV